MSEREPSLLGVLSASEKEESEAKPSEIPNLFEYLPFPLAGDLKVLRCSLIKKCEAD